MYDCYGEDNIIPITCLAQVIFYASKFKVQPKFIYESVKNKGHVVFYYHKGETKLPYEDWMKNKENKGDSYEKEEKE